MKRTQFVAIGIAKVSDWTLPIEAA